MARFYHVDIARFVARSDAKWVDNLLSHFEIPGVESARQGLARRISADGIHHIALIRLLTKELGLATGVAVTTATGLLAGQTRVELGEGIALVFDQNRFEGSVDRLIAEAVESVTPARRGRPPKRAGDF